MRKKTVLRIIILALIILWMLIVFGFSNQSGEESTSVSRQVASFFVKTEEQINMIEPYIRKIAHLSEYACGGVLFLSMFLTFDFSDIKRMVYALIVGIEYATLDEIHQLFIKGRSGQVVDVFIDSIGVSIGICVWMLIFKVFRKIFAKRKEGV